MIQRVQTVYWAVAIILMGVFLTMSLFTYGPEGVAGTAFKTLDCTLLAISTGVTILLTLAAILMFKNRPLQIKLGYVAVVGYIATHVLMWGHYYLLGQGEAPAVAGDVVSILPWVALPTVALVLNILAIGGVKKDHKIVKAADRLR